MEIRKAAAGDIALLTENRMKFVSAFQKAQYSGQFKALTEEYLRKHLEDETLIAYLALEDGAVLSSCILCIYETLPIPSCPNGKNGLLLNVFTREDYRRQGLAQRLLTELIGEAKRLGVGKILLNFTDAGFPLYQKLGFVKSENAMTLRLTD